MTRNFRNFVFFMIGCFLGGWSVFSHADYSPSQIWTAGSGSGPGNVQACEDYRVKAGATLYTTSLTQGLEGAICVFIFQYGGTWTPSDAVLAVTYGCPNGGSLDPVSNMCKFTACPAAGTSTPGVTGNPYGGDGIMPSTLCINGCSYDWGSVAVQLANSWGATAAKATGQSCSTSTSGSNGTPATNSPPSDPQPNSAKNCIDQGQGYGTVNGAVVCTGPANSTQTKNGSSQTTTKPDGSTGTTNTTSITTCNAAGACSTTTTINNSGGGSGPGGQPNGTTTTQTEQSKADFCQANPADILCQDKKETFAAPGAGSFEGKQTEIQQLQQQLDTQFNTVKTQVGNMFGRLTTGGGSLQCDQGVSIPSLNINFNLCFTGMQQHLGPIQVAVIAMASLLALYIIFA